MGSENNRNMIIAIVLSVVVLFGWQFFIAGPQLEQAQKRAAAEQQATATDQSLATPTGTTAGTATTPGAAADTTQAGTFATREAAIAASSRVAIDFSSDEPVARMPFASGGRAQASPRPRSIVPTPIATSLPASL